MDICSCASGSRRTTAAAVVVNSLGAVDLIAAVVTGEHQESVAASVREALRAQPGLHVLSAESRPRPERWSVEASELPNRTVLLWEQVDALIEQDPNHFHQTAAELCRALGAGRTDAGEPNRLHRAVLIGGRALLDRIHALHELSGDEVRFRYILVE